MKTKKENRLEYKTMKFKAGIFQIRNLLDNTIFLKISTDLDRAFNSELFKLNAGMHPNHQLQQDWNNLGAVNFEFKLFDELKTSDDDSNIDIHQALSELLEIHVNDLKTNRQSLYM